MLLKLLESELVDVFMSLGTFLRVENMLVFSMVSKQCKHTVDAIWQKHFAAAVRFTLRRFLYHNPSLQPMTLDANRQALTHRYRIQSFNELWKLCTQATLKVGSTTHMRFAMKVPCKYVQFKNAQTEEILPWPGHVPGLLKANYAFLIIFTSWRVGAVSGDTVEVDDVGTIRRKIVHLTALECQCRQHEIPQVCFEKWNLHPHDSICINPIFPCELVIDMTPDFSIAWRHHTAGYTLTTTEKNDLKQYCDVFGQLNTLNIREIAVVRSLKTCMHCVQRTAFYTTCAGVPSQFRKLCRLCWGMFFVKRTSLVHTYKLNLNYYTRRTLQQTPCYLFREYDYSDGIFVKAYLKTELAVKLGFSSWEDFIANNYLSPQPHSRFQARGLNRYNFTRCALCE